MTASPSMVGRVAVVTGATSGIGLEIARGLAVRGARVVIVGRGEERTRGVAADLARTTGNPAIEGLPVADLADRAECAALAATLLERLPALHVLVNNAGAFYARRETTREGIERTFALNVLAPLALTCTLLPKLEASRPARVVNVASSAHQGMHVDLSDVEGKLRYQGYQAYGRSKLELILLTRELARRLAGTGVSVNAVHPGFIRSGFGQNNGGGVAFMIRLASWIGGHNVVYGARTPLRVACDPALEVVSGQYFARETVAAGSEASQDGETGRQLLQLCLGYLQLPPLPEPTPDPAR